MRSKISVTTILFLYQVFKFCLHFSFYNYSVYDKLLLLLAIIAQNQLYIILNKLSWRLISPTCDAYRCTSV